jgi:hypothetical protein
MANKAQTHSFVYEYAVVPTSFVEETSLIEWSWQLCHKLFDHR